MASTSPKLSIGKTIKKISAGILLTIITSASVCALAYCAYFYFHAEEFGNTVGATAGKAAGKLVGSYEGMTQGVAEGKKEGKEEGMSAKDTEVNIGNKIQTVGKLEVLSASVVLHDVLGISDEYKTLLAFYGDVIFTIDLNNADIQVGKDKIDVVIPLPEASLVIDDKKSEQLKTYMKHNYSGSTEDGYTAAKNSIHQMTEKVEESVANYNVLMDSAKESAIEQVSFLIQSASKGEVSIHVEFKEDNEQVEQQDNSEE